MNEKLKFICLLVVIAIIVGGLQVIDHYIGLNCKQQGGQLISRLGEFDTCLYRVEVKNE